MRRAEHPEVRLIGYGPRTSVKLDGECVDVPPDLFVALEGIGTFEGISFEERLRSLLSKGKDPLSVAKKAHRESTRRGHASLSTCVFVQFEVSGCSRIGSMLLVASRFGSYLQESQRRKRVDDSYLLYPSELEGSPAMEAYEECLKACMDAYDRLCDGGVSMEDARYVLPLGIRTSVFVSITLEGLIPLILLSRRWEVCRDTLPLEVKAMAERIHGMLMDVSPNILEARLAFDGGLAHYPIPNPFKPEDPVTRLAASKGYPPEPVLLEMSVADASILGEDMQAVYDFACNSIRASFLEPMSLVAYHQAVRHRTVPTVPESAYSAVDRAILDVARWVKVPPSIDRDAALRGLFLERVSSSLNAYKKMLSMGVRKSSAIYLVPQAVILYVLRLYDGFNLLSPMGFVATRTCSQSQHEERGIAYRVWSDVRKAVPELAGRMGEKCRHLGYCPEREWCPVILKYRSYDDEEHRKAMP